MTKWIATGFGALDLREHELAEQGFDVIVTPASAAEPRILFGEGARLWRQLIPGPLDDSELSESSRHTLQELEAMNVAARDIVSSSRIDRLETPWLLSVVHELVYAILARVAEQNEIEIVFIKGPTLHAQGLREREHSGDVDCWVRPGDDLRLAKAMEEWGWVPLYSAFQGTGVSHSLTLRKGSWGCAVDVHTRFPGMDIDANTAFDIVLTGSETRSFAGVTARTPSRSVHAVIAALHEVRPYFGAQPSRDQIEAARFALHAAGAEEVLPAVERLRAGYVLEGPLRAAFPGFAGRTRGTPPADWAWRSMPGGPRRYLKALRLVPVDQRPRVLWRLLWPSADQLRTAYETPEASGWELLRLRALRLVRSLINYFRQR